MNNILLYIGGLFVAVFAALFAVPAMIDWNGYRGVFEEEATKLLGRDVRVGGKVNVSLLPSPYVRFEKVRLADVTGQTGEPFIRAESFTMRLAGPPLLRGVLEAKEIEFDRPVLTLALDGAGGGNWQDIRLQPGALPFVPRDVTLRSVRIIDGSIALYRPNADLVGRVEKIDGELSADGLAGPFRFKGDVDWGKSRHDVRFATTEVAANGTFRVKAVVKTPTGSAGGVKSGRGGDDSTASFNLDAEVSHSANKPVLKGDITGVFPVRFGAAAASKGARESDDEPTAETPATPPVPAPVIDMKSRVEADTNGAKFDDIALSLRDTAVPQVMNGSATATWQDHPLISLTLGAKWFDLDRLAGAGERSAPFARLKQLALGTMSAIAGDTAAVAAINLEQVKLGGETAGGLKIDAERRDSVVRLKTLQASLPGGSRVALSGTIKDQTDGPVFEGDGHVHGTSLARLRAWAEKSGATIDIRADGAFSAEGHLLMSASQFALSEASAEIAGQPMTGEVLIIEGDRQRAEITLESTKLDSRVLFPETIGELTRELRDALGLDAKSSVVAEATNDSAVRTKASVGTPGSDIKLRILAAELNHDGKMYRDVDATIDLLDGQIKIPMLRATTAKGLTLAIDGHVSKIEGRPKGILAFDVVAADAAALGELSALLDVTDAIGANRITSWSSGKFAGAVRLGERAASTADVSLNGTLGGARVALNAEFDSGLMAWRTAPSRLRGVADDATLATFLKGFGAQSAGGIAGGDQPAEVRVAMSGQLGSLADASFSLISDPVTLAFDGRVGVPSESPVRVDGQLRIAARDVAAPLTVAGLLTAPGLVGTKAQGTIALVRDDGDVRFDATKFTLGATSFSANGTISSVVSKSDAAASDASSRYHVAAKVSADEVVLTSLLSVVLDPPKLVGEAEVVTPTPATDTAAVTTQDVAEAADGPDADDVHASVWPEGTLNFDVTNAVTAAIDLSFSSLELSRGLVAGKGAGKIVIADGSFGFTNIDADVGGGRLGGQLTLSKAPGGAQFDTNLAIQDLELSRVTAKGQGTTSLQIAASGRGGTLATMLGLASGSGRVTIDKATLAVPDVDHVAELAETILSGSDGPEVGDDGGNSRRNARRETTMPETIDDALTDRIAAAMAPQAMALGSRSFDVSIASGRLQVEPGKITTARGLATFKSQVELATLAVESAWSVAVEPKQYAPTEIPSGWAPPAAKSALPPIAVTYQGQLGKLVGLEPTVNSSDMQRELVVRQMERNVQELERLRLLDVERAQKEAERREAERAAREAARNQPDQLPPILPESYQSEGPPNATGSTANGGAVTDHQATVDVAPQPAPVSQPRPQPRPQAPPRRRLPSRTATDEVMRSLGGFP